MVEESPDVLGSRRLPPRLLQPPPHEGGLPRCCGRIFYWGEAGEAAIVVGVGVGLLGSRSAEGEMCRIGKFLEIGWGMCVWRGQLKSGCSKFGKIRAREILALASAMTLGLALGLGLGLGLSWVSEGYGGGGGGVVSSRSCGVELLPRIEAFSQYFNSFGDINQQGVSLASLSIVKR